jgi:hypothetical protein
VEQLQPLLDDAVASIVEHDEDHRQLLVRAVHSAWIEYMALPSPSMATTLRSGWAS